MDKKNHQDDIYFGQAMRLRRTRLGVTLEQLSEETKISMAVLSRVERGHHSPTLRNALAIARGLGCELMELVENKPAEIVRAGDNLRFLDKETNIVRIALARPDPNIEILQYIVPMGMKSRNFAPHEPGSREIFYILKGCLVIHTAQQTISLSEGDTATVRVDMEHWFQNNGDESTHIFLTVLGGNL